MTCVPETETPIVFVHVPGSLLDHFKRMNLDFRLRPRLWRRGKRRRDCQRSGEDLAPEARDAWNCGGPEASPERNRQDDGGCETAAVHRRTPGARLRFRRETAPNACPGGTAAAETPISGAYQKRTAAGSPATSRGREASARCSDSDGWPWWRRRAWPVMASPAPGTRPDRRAHRMTRPWAANHTEADACTVFSAPPGAPCVADAAVAGLGECAADEGRHPRFVVRDEAARQLVPARDRRAEPRGTTRTSPNGDPTAVSNEPRDRERDAALDADHVRLLTADPEEPGVPLAVEYRKRGRPDGRTRHPKRNVGFRKPLTTGARPERPAVLTARLQSAHGVEQT